MVKGVCLIGPQVVSTCAALLLPTRVTAPSVPLVILNTEQGPPVLLRTTNMRHSAISTSRYINTLQEPPVLLLSNNNNDNTFNLEAPCDGERTVRPALH